MKRISVVGNSGSGKSTLARRLSARLGLPRLELDSVMHQPNWTPIADDEFRARVSTFMEATPGWVIDGNYPVVRDAVWWAADTVVWLDPPRLANMRAVIGRTVVRLLTRRTLWNGNRERWSNLFRLDPEASVIAWAWRHHGARRAELGEAMKNPRWGHLAFVHLADRAATARWLASLKP